MKTGYTHIQITNSIAWTLNSTECTVSY